MIIFWRALCEIHIKFPHVWKLANQATLNKAHVIEITKLWKIAFMKARDWKKNRMVKIYFLKLPANKSWLT